MRVLVVLLVMAGAAAAVYALHKSHPWVLEDGDNVAAFTYLSILLGALLWGGAVSMGGMRKAVLHLSLWAVVIAGLAIGYENRDALRLSALRALAVAAPGEAVEIAPGETVLTRARSGHFIANARVNGERVRMLVDTGATDVALPYDEARRIGVDVAALRFDRPVLTANGRAVVASVLLDEVEVGGVRFYNVRGSVAEPGRLPSALLGMSFLNRLTEFSFRGDQLILRP